MNLYIGPLVKMLRVVGVALAHNGGGDDGIDLDPGYTGTTVRNGAQNVDPAPGPDDGELAVWTQHIRQGRRRRHEIALPLRLMPARYVRIHDVGRSVRVNDYHFGLIFPVDFHPRECVPARKLHLRWIAEPALRVHHVDQTT